MTTLTIACNSAGNSLGLYDLDGAGKLSPLGELPLPGVGAPEGAYPMTLNADRTRLYVSFRGRPHEVLTYGLTPNARSIELLGRAPLDGSMAHIALDTSGRFLLSASFGAGTLSTNAIGETGIASAPIHTIDVAPNMHCCIPIPGTDTFLATSLGADATFRVRCDDRGKLTVLDDRAISAPGSGPRHFVFHPTLPVGYLVTQMASTVEVFAFADGRLSAAPVETHSILPANWQGEPWAADIRITPDGRHLYASDRKANSLAAFAIDDRGRLTPAGITYAAPWPRAMNITPDGAFLLALGENSDIVDVFAIGADGALAKCHALPTGRGPSWVEFA